MNYSYVSSSASTCPWSSSSCTTTTTAAGVDPSSMPCCSTVIARSCFLVYLAPRPISCPTSSLFALHTSKRLYFLFALMSSDLTRQPCVFSQCFQFSPFLFVGLQWQLDARTVLQGGQHRSLEISFNFLKVASLPTSSLALLEILILTYPVNSFSLAKALNPDLLFSTLSGFLQS